MTEQELRALDAQVAEKVMGLKILSHDWPWGDTPTSWCEIQRPEHTGPPHHEIIRPLRPSPDHTASWFTERGPVVGVYVDDGSLVDLEIVKFYSTDIAAAFTVVEKMAEKGFRIVIVAPRGELGSPADRWSCGFLDHFGGYWQKEVLDGHLDFYAEADKLPEAICLASLQAVEAER